MKDPIDKFRFDEDSDHGHTRRYHGTSLKPVKNSYSSPTECSPHLTDISSPKSPFGAGSFGEHIPNYTDTSSMDYLQATQDLSPLRPDYTLSSPSSQEVSSHAAPSSYHKREPHILPGGYKQEDYDSGYPVTYGFSDQDHNSNLLATSPPKNPLPDKNVHSSREYSTDVNNQSYSSRENMLDVSKSVSSGDSRGGGQVYSDRFSHAQSLKYARERNLREARDNLRYRSTSLGETGSTRNLNNTKEISKGRTPSAPGDLSNRSQSYYGNRDVEYGGLQTPAGRSMGSVMVDRSRTGESDRVRSGQSNRSAESRLSRIDTVNRQKMPHNILSGEYRVQDHNKSNLSTNSTIRVDDSLNRSSPLYSRETVNNNGYSVSSLTRDPLTHRKLTSSQPNGAAKLLRDMPPATPCDPTKSSLGLNSSKESMSSGTPQPYVQEYGVINSLVSLALMSLLGLVVCFISLQLLFRLNNRTVTGLLPNANSVLTNSSYGNVLEVTIALTTFVVMLDLCCLLVCSMQCFFAAKLVKCQRGEERCFKYLKECAGTRFIAVTGFFISIPVLLLALLLYMLMEFTATPAIIATVILTVGLTFATITIVHSVYFWRVEKNKADLNIPPYESRRPKGSPSRSGILSQSELSTLV